MHAPPRAVGLRSVQVRGLRLTLFGRSLLLVVCEVLVNAICWTVCGILFGRSAEMRPVLSLALLAWTIGLRHALDADHISAIDNATRNLIGQGQLPVTCGLFFSLGHSTIVIAVNVAIAVSTDIYDRLDGVSRVGGIVGTAVSGSFLFIVGLANSIILWRLIRRKREQKKRCKAAQQKGEEGLEEIDDNPKHGHMLMMRVLGPVVNFVDRPWKMYPVGVLFGFGFDTASSIALLSISAIAKKSDGGNAIPPSDIILLPLLFTTGMTLIDSCDSILMLYSYSGFPERSFKLFEHGAGSARPITPESTDTKTKMTEDDPEKAGVGLEKALDVEEIPANSLEKRGQEDEDKMPQQPTVDATRKSNVKRNAISSLSIILTLMSILVAFAISLIEIMGLIGDNCRKCQEAVEAQDGGGLAGRWWRGWASANDQSGYIGVAIVGVFIAVVGGWYGLVWIKNKMRSRQEHARSAP